MMIYVPCVIHVIFWLGKAGEPYRSIALFEMPVIFYISGATMYVTKKNRNFISTAKNRIKRIILPYYFYALICCLFILLLGLYFPGRENITLKSAISLMFAQNGEIPIPFFWHTWFIIPYLVVSCSFPIQKKWADKVNRWIYMLILIIVLCLLQPLWNYSSSKVIGVVRESLYYNFFFIAGYLFYKRISLKSLILVSLISGLIMGGLIFKEYDATEEFIMQNHKFPPDLVFLSFGTFCLGVLALIFENFTIPQNRILRHWNKYGYTIYLWQNISFWIYTIIYYHSSLQHISSHPILDFIVASLSIFILSTLTSLIIAPIEKIILDCISHKISFNHSTHCNGQ